MSEPTQLWGGRFKSGPSEALANLSRSHPSYFRLYREDLAGSRAHASELKRAGVLDEAEFVAIRETLDRIEADVASGNEKPIASDEDIHTFLERLLMQRLGVLGGKLRAGRSRNDQTSNNTRLYLRRRRVNCRLALSRSNRRWFRRRSGIPKRLCLALPIFNRHSPLCSVTI